MKRINIKYQKTFVIPATVEKAIFDSGTFVADLQRTGFMKEKTASEASSDYVAESIFKRFKAEL